jgi:hypothetical protein
MRALKRFILVIVLHDRQSTEIQTLCALGRALIEGILKHAEDVHELLVLHEKSYSRTEGEKVVEQFSDEFLLSKAFYEEIASTVSNVAFILF